MKGNFKVIITVIFVGLAIIGVFVFSGAIPIGSNKNKNAPTGSVVVWGTIKTDLIQNALNTFNDKNKTFVTRYVQKYPETFDRDLLEALASSKGPDLFFLPNDLAYNYSNKLFLIPYTSYPVANFKSSFAGAGEVFMTSKGILAFPIAIDPLMMYYNRNILDSNNVVFPPAYWEELAILAPKMTKKDDSKKISQSTTALGQFVNVKNAKDILTSLFMQGGSSIVKEEKGFFASNLSIIGLGNMLSFYTDFSNPLKDTYSWNRSLPNSQDAFASDDVGFYFGFASELETLINKNPNLNLEVAPIPQIKNINSKATTAKVLGIAVSSASKNLNTALSAASLMANGDFAAYLANVLKVAPARRDLLANIKPTDAFFPDFYASALFAKSWLDPEPNDSNDVFQAMIDGVLSNNKDPESAVRDAGSRIDLLLVK